MTDSCRPNGAEYAGSTDSAGRLSSKTDFDERPGPNYTVAPPSDLNISSRSISTNSPTLLGDIVRGDMGATHVVICREHIHPR